jgi:N-carbamoyl-L-amino-acid hydrolase
MALRKDALVASARMIDAVNKIGHDHLPGACATCGFIEVKPNSRNTIPGDVFFTVDLRHPSDEILADMDQAFRERCKTIASDSDVDLRVEDFWHFPATPFDDACVEAVRSGAERGGYANMDIVSGAGHDAVYMARIAPTGMIFIPCEGGVSHNEIENATREDCAAGAQVLLSAIVARASTQVG